MQTLLLASSISQNMCAIAKPAMSKNRDSTIGYRSRYGYRRRYDIENICVCIYIYVHAYMWLSPWQALCRQWCCWPRPQNWHPEAR